MNQQSPLTFWENVRKNTHWGKYVTSIEEETLAHALATTEPSVALEIGTEGGHWARQLLGQGWEVVCTEINREALQVTKQRLPQAECVRVGSADSTLPFKSGSLGLILCFEVFEVMHADWFFSEASRILKAGGVFVGVTHNRTSLRSIANRTARALTGRHAAWQNDDYSYKMAYPEWRDRMAHNNLRVTYEEGLCWLPFHRKSNFFLIPALTGLEHKLGLRKLPQFSPWVAFVARKSQVK